MPGTEARGGFEICEDILAVGFRLGVSGPRVDRRRRVTEPAHHAPPEEKRSTMRRYGDRRRREFKDERPR